MTKVPETKEIYDFGAFRIDVRKRRLYRNGDEISLTPKEFELLFILVENAGRVVEKDDLHEKIWQDTFVEDGTLTRNISWLRKKLGDGSGGGEKFIETMPKRGYRFLPEVTKSFNPNTLVIEEQTRTHIRIEETVTSPSVADTSGPKGLDTQFPVSLSRGVPVAVVLALGVITFIAIGLSVYQLYFRQPSAKDSVAVRIVPFSGSLGREDNPAFSPDGKQLAFAWNGGEADNLSIYVRLMNAGEPIRLTNTEFTERHPTFSPDGSHIAFVRSLKTHGEVVIIPALGGAERRVASLFSGFASVSFAPDGETLAVIDTDDSTEGKPYAVYLIDLATGERRRLNPPGEYTGETTPRFAPDGKSLAFVRVFADRTQDLFIAPMTGGESRRITSDGTVIHSLAWGGDSSEIFFVSVRGNNQPNVWRVAAAGGAADLIATGGNKDITNLAVSHDGKAIAFVENTINLDIWKIGKNQPEKKLIGSTYSESSPQLSPDSSRVVFVSNRSGKNEIWLSDAAGKNLRQITNSESNVAAPDFSPDGSNIVYFARTNGNADIFSISAEGGVARRLTTGASEDTLPIWNYDGSLVYFVSNRTGENQIWKMAAAGGEPVQITRQGVAYIVATSPGGSVFYLRANDNNVWTVSASGGGFETIVAELAASALFDGNWSRTRQGLYFLARDLNKSLKIKFYDFSGGPVRDAIDYKLPDNFYAGITAAADGSTFLFARRDQDASSIMLAELPKVYGSPAKVNDD